MKRTKLPANRNSMNNGHGQDCRISACFHAIVAKVSSKNEVHSASLVETCLSWYKAVRAPKTNKTKQNKKSRPRRPPPIGLNDLPKKAHELYGFSAKILVYEDTRSCCLCCQDLSITSTSTHGHFAIEDNRNSAPVAKTIVHKDARSRRACDRDLSMKTHAVLPFCVNRKSVCEDTKPLCLVRFSCLPPGCFLQRPKCLGKRGHILYGHHRNDSALTIRDLVGGHRPTKKRACVEKQTRRK